ncbi:MAG: coproporphyrinogen dehydrogenase HemZ [Clostridia bacterium]|nr:coproporphyrinogen dehydrogenase HemZ [Clostridia bacterium]
MIKLELVVNDYKFEIENIIQLFFPDKKVSLVDGDFAKISVFKHKLSLSVSVKIFDGFYQKNSFVNYEYEAERELCRLLFEILSQVTGITPKWGIQTGVRPTKLLRNLTEKHGEIYAKDFFYNKLLVCEEKYNMAKNIVEIQDEIMTKKAENSFSLYISIPFCVSRCSYCSFISHDIEKSKKLIPEYVAKLLEEIEYTAKIAKDLGLVLQTVYIGGGTPTVLDENDLSLIMNAVHKHFDTSNLLEFTVEAGRPDTITKEKLVAIKQNGGTRISINPQTLNDDVLRIIKRKHTVKEFYDAYELAQSVGFDNINTDLIAGLPGDTLETFCDTIDKISNLSPACVTVHCLSVKRSSTLVYKGDAQYNPTGEIVSKMLDYSQNILNKSGYNPYYMYRQSKMAGNNENIGWAKDGFESFYNVFIMEEIQTILALGGGASTKLVKNDKIERIFNYKYPYEYINGFDEILKRKQKIYDFFN